MHSHSPSALLLLQCSLEVTLSLPLSIISQVAWLRVESKTILTIHHHVITRNYRISLSHSDDRHWNLHISDVQESDRGGYMCKCSSRLLNRTMLHDAHFTGNNFTLSLYVSVPAGQINTVPMEYQVGYLDVVGKLIHCSDSEKNIFSTVLLSRILKSSQLYSCNYKCTLDALEAVSWKYFSLS